VRRGGRDAARRRLHAGRVVDAIVRVVDRDHLDGFEDLPLVEAGRAQAGQQRFIDLGRMQGQTCRELGERALAPGQRCAAPAKRERVDQVGVHAMFLRRRRVREDAELAAVLDAGHQRRQFALERRQMPVRRAHQPVEVTLIERQSLQCERQPEEVAHVAEPFAALGLQPPGVGVAARALRRRSRSQQ
jgi:hypothetical protein